MIFMKASSYLLLALLAITTFCKTAEKNEVATIAISGIVSDYPETKGHLNLMGYFVDPYMSGTIDTDGTVNLELPDDFDTITTTAFEKYNSGGDAAYELSPMEFSDLFVDLEGLEVSGQDAQIFLAGKYYGFEIFQDEIKLGTIYPTTSLEYMGGIKKPDESTGTTGHHYVLLYLDQPISIQGEQSQTNYVNDDPDRSFTTSISYDLELQKGWNVYKHSIDEYFNDDLGNFFPKSQQFITSSVDDIENWNFLPL